jgi:hypothetical protein
MTLEEPAAQLRKQLDSGYWSKVPVTEANIRAVLDATEPTAPPHPMEKTREARENARRDERTVERRAKALELAVSASVGGIVVDQELSCLAVADLFLTYIETGERPA